MNQPIRAGTHLFTVGRIISFLGYSWRLTEHPWSAEEAVSTGLRPTLPELLNELRRYLPSLETHYNEAGGSSAHAAGLASLAGRCCDLAHEIVGLFPAQETVVMGRPFASIRVRIGQIARGLGEWLASVVRSEDWEINIKLKQLTKEAESFSSVRSKQIMGLARGVRMALGLPNKDTEVDTKGQSYQSKTRVVSSFEDSGQENQPRRRIKTKKRRRPNTKLKFAVEDENTEQDAAGLPNWFAQVKDNFGVLDELLKDVPFELRLLRLLAYDSMDSREDSIQDAEGSTFDWMLDDNTSLELEPELVKARESYIHWLRGGQGIFHISGKPGAGKSTLLKVLCNHRRTKSELQTWAGDSEVVVASFFFWNSGNPMQTSLEGLFRSLLVQVSRQFPKLMPDLFANAWEALAISRTNGDHFPDEALLDYDAIRTAWRKLRDMETGQYCMCFFIDGLDEYTQTEDGPSYEEFAGQFVDWAGWNSDAKFCVSSRPYPEFLDAFGLKQRLHLHDLTARDIKAFASKSFSSLQDTQYHNTIVSLVNAITERSSGVFVWVRTAVRSLLALMKRDAEPEVVLDQVKEYPSDIYELYDYLLNSLQPGEQSEATHMIRLIIGNPFSQPPNALWLSWTDELDDRSFPDPSSSKPHTVGEVTRRHEVVRDKLDWLAKGLLVMFTDRREPKNGDQFYRQRVQFFHRTARDFFLMTIGSDHKDTDTPPHVRALPMGEVDLTETFARLRLAEIVLAGKYRAAPGADPRRRRLYFNYLRSLFGLKDGPGSPFQIPARYLDILRRDLQTTHEPGFGSPYAVSGFRYVSKPGVLSEDPEKAASFLHLVLVYGQHEYVLGELRRRGDSDGGTSEVGGKGKSKGKDKSKSRGPEQLSPGPELHFLLSAASGGRSGGRIPPEAFQALLPLAGDPLAAVTMRPPISNDFLTSVSREASVLLVLASVLVFSCQRGAGLGEGLGRREVQNARHILDMLRDTVEFVARSGRARETGADGSPRGLTCVLRPRREAVGGLDDRSATRVIAPSGESVTKPDPAVPTYYTTLKEISTIFRFEEPVELLAPDQGINDDGRVFVPSSRLGNFVCTRVVLADGSSLGIEDDLCFRIY